MSASLVCFCDVDYLHKLQEGHGDYHSPCATQNLRNWLRNDALIGLGLHINKECLFICLRMLTPISQIPGEGMGVGSFRSYFASSKIVFAEASKICCRERSGCFFSIFLHNTPANPLTNITR